MALRINVGFGFCVRGSDFLMLVNFWFFCLVLFLEQAPAEQCSEVRAVRGKTLYPVKHMRGSDRSALDYQCNLKDLDLK